MRTKIRTLAVLLALLGPSLSVQAQERPRDWQPPLPESVPNYREEWRQIIMELAKYAKGRNPKFVILLRDGQELLVKGQREVDWDKVRDPTNVNFDKRLPLGAPFRTFLRSIDGVVFDQLYCGDAGVDKPMDDMIRARKDEDDRILRDRLAGIEEPGPSIELGPYSADPKVEMARSQDLQHRADIAERRARLMRGLAVLKGERKTILSIENCPSQAMADNAWKWGVRDHVATFAAVNDAALDQLPKGHPLHENAQPVDNASKIQSWLPMASGIHYGGKDEWVSALMLTSYDAIMIDVAWRATELITKADVAKLKYKNLGAPRMILAEMPMGRAYDWRWYWNKDWVAGNPAFLFAVDQRCPGVFVTDPLSPQWKEILGKYLAGIVDLGFDGIIMDDLDTYLWFEDIMPLDR